MKINIFKDMTWINELEQYNTIIKEVAKNYNFGKRHYDVNKNEASEWFDPAKYRLAPLSRTYPNVALEQHKPEYKLIDYIPNYLVWFLTKELYTDNKNVPIEDFGAGAGRCMFFLSKLGFTNLHTFELWTQCSRQLFEDLMTAGNISYTLNDVSFKPVILNNCSAPWVFGTHGLDNNRIFTSRAEGTKPGIIRDVSSLELICLYTNREWEELAPKILEPQGYSFLCKDADDIGFAWCKNDKLKEFKEKLKSYEC